MPHSSYENGKAVAAATDYLQRNITDKIQAIEIRNEGAYPPENSLAAYFKE